MTTDQPCPHGNAYACGLCMGEDAPKCEHGNPFYCGHCGRVPPEDQPDE